MDLFDALKTRKSIRAFRPDPVPRGTIEQVLDLATRAPSAINLQPWELVVVTGDEKARLARTLIKAYREKQISCGPGNVKPLPKTYGRRGAKTLGLMNPFFDEMGVGSAPFINEGSCNFYGAPVAILILQDDAFPKARYVDVGLCLGYLLLAAHDVGLSTCPIGLIAAYEDEIKELLNIPENKTLLVGVALGYPDPESPVNRFKSQREDLGKLVRWVE
jgi:nitroreductase